LKAAKNAADDQKNQAKAVPLAAEQRKDGAIGDKKRRRRAPKLTPERAYGVITEQVSLIAVKAENISEMVLRGENPIVMKAVSNGLGKIFEELDVASFNLGNSDLSEMTPKLKLLLRKNIAEGEQYRLVPEAMAGAVSFTKLEEKQILAMENLVRKSRLLALGTEGVALKSDQLKSAMEMLLVYKETIAQCRDMLDDWNGLEFDGSESVVY
jgi:hypothetical protein